MSESESEQTGGIDDDQLPDDLQPGDDNPLAEAPDDDELLDDLDVLGGKDAEQDDGQPGDDEES